MFLPIVVYGHPILRKISEDITPEYPELEKFIRDLFQTMDEADGVGLAAPQVGRNIRIFVVDANAFEEMDPDCKGFRKAFINAHILERWGDEISRMYQYPRYPRRRQTPQLYTNQLYGRARTRTRRGVLRY